MSWFNFDFTTGGCSDKFLLSSKLVDLAKKCDIASCCLSNQDYGNLFIDCASSAPRGPGIWKFNNSLLSDETCCEYLSRHTSDLSLCLMAFNSVKSWWDFFKNSLKSFCLRDRGRLGNEGWPISLKIATQSRYVDLCNVPKFQLQRHSFSRVLDISTSGVPRGWVLVQFWPPFNLSFSNVQLISDKNKTMFVMPYSWASMDKNISSRECFVSLWLLSQLVLFEAYGKQPEMACF